MGDKRNFAALEWVSGEISDTLKEARQSLEAYVEDPKDSTRIRFCLTHIHQVHGSLQMVEFHGAALLAEEMEQTAQAIMDNAVVSIPEAQEVLMRALLQLPIYLDHAKSSKEDNPAQVMPLLNDMRAVRKQSYLSETNLFSPDLSAVGTAAGEKHVVLQDVTKLTQVLKKLREMYQFAAASVLRGIKVEENLGYLDKVFSRLEMITTGTLCHPIWEVSAALIDGLKRDDIELTVAVRGLLRYIARELRLLGEKAPQSLETTPSEALLKNLLYYVARAEDGSAKVAAIKNKYRLSSALLGPEEKGPENLLQTPDADAIRSVVVALQEELNNIKRVLDVALSGQGSSTEIKEVLPSVKRVADTLAVLGIGDLRKSMLEQCDALEKISEANSVDESELMQTASNIIEVEHRLKAIAKSAGKHSDLSNVDERAVEIDGAKATVIKECIAGLHKAKEAIVDFISSQWDRQHLADVNTLLSDIRGGLNMIPLSRPAAIMDACASFIESRLLDGDQEPDFRNLELLADAMASVEYYLERLTEDLYEDSDAMLDIAEESVAALGYEVTAEPRVAADETVQVPKALPEVEETQEEPEEGGILTPVFEPTAESTFVAHDTIPEAPQDEGIADASVHEADEPALEAEFVQDSADSGSFEVLQETPNEHPEVQAEQVDELTGEAPVTEETGAQQTETESHAGVPESDIDDEIVEIFIEEAGEVLETLNEYFPQWKAKDSDQDALVIVRRAFHTLKGSGRMVEAFDIGELAWSVENMLNRVIDRTIKVQPHIFHLIDAVIALIPELVKAFEERRPNPRKDLTSQYEAWAHQIAEGTFPDALLEPMGDVPAAASVSDAVAEESQTAAVETIESDALTSFDMEEEQGVDSVLQEIFSQEAVTHLETVEGFIRQMEREAPIYSVPTDALQRALHTLKGSAKMAQVWPIAEITEPLEHFAKELIAYQMSISDDILQLIRDAVDYTRIGLAQIENGEKVEIPKVSQFVARTDELRDLSLGHLVRSKESDMADDNKVDPRLLSLVMAEEITLLLDADEFLRSWQQSGTHGEEIERLLNELSILEKGAQQARLSDMASLCRRLSEAHGAAIADRLASNGAFFALMHDGHEMLLDMIDAVAAGQNMQPVPEELSDRLDALLDSAGEEVPVMADVDETIEPQAPSFDLNWDEASVESADPASDVNAEHESTFEEALEISYDDAPVTDEHQETPLTFEVGEDEDIELNFDFAADDFAPDADTGEAATDVADETPVDPFDGPTVTEDEFVDLDTPAEQPVAEDASVEEDSWMLDTAASSGNEDDVADLSATGELSSGHKTDDSELSFETADDTAAEVDDTESIAFDIGDNDLGELADLDISEDASDALDIEAFEDVQYPAAEVVDDEAILEQSDPAEFEAVLEPSSDATPTADAGDSPSIPGLLDTLDATAEDYDRDIIEVFIEEADELVESLDEAIHAWESNWSDNEAVEEIKRVLHTLKGGARLAGLNNLGELTHDYETMLIDMGEDLSGVDGAFFGRMHGYQDKILSAVRAVKTFSDGDYTRAEAQPLEAPRDTRDAEDSAEIVQEATIEPAPAEEKEAEGSNVVRFAPKPKAVTSSDPGGFTMPTVSGGGGGSQAAAKVALKKAGPQEVVKVSAELLEELVNLAGETSINRSRLEQYITDFSYALDEVDATLNRLQDQLRRLDIETEAQILFRQEQMEAHEEFDPLEMDRYSHLQQLSRSLIESASDLTDLKSDLSEKIRMTETLLLQQSRINTTLQEGLMRSRMVPFSRLVPRLRRIVRQVASELDKNVSFELDNVEGELDRSVLERMVPPFEHMLRNAVDHGIESPEDRNAAGKSETGRIVLTLAREGGDVVIRLADDGRGIDLQRVRKKAIERELMAADAELSDHDIMQFILHAGFSTAENVTQISGRGVGMDVVNAEIKQLGGSVTINSAWGKGTEFVIRLPFTLSINRALMVSIGQDQYAVPLSSIEGIVRVSPFELEHYYSSPEAQFEYANENYHVRYLGSLLNTVQMPTLEGHVLPLPVLLVRSAEHTMAVQVDAVMGSREIVVKNLGVQFSTVAGLSGATVMGDGSVVVILDPHALVRQEIARATLPQEQNVVELQPAEEVESSVKRIMVVDDSVTVRKVTTRFLEREGFEVVTAKDGVDALRLLQDDLPDLMLLDIEMPRMDGFEVAKTIRTTQRWEHLPIIMITSRTGDKHREHALSLGVNNYLGKPYQEDLLLEAIGVILDKPAGSA